MLVERNPALAVVAAMTAGPHHGDFAHARQDELRGLLMAPFQRPPAFLALWSGKRHVHGF